MYVQLRKMAIAACLVAFCTFVWSKSTHVFLQVATCCAFTCTHKAHVILGRSCNCMCFSRGLSLDISFYQWDAAHVHFSCTEKAHVNFSLSCNCKWTRFRTPAMRCSTCAFHSDSECARVFMSELQNMRISFEICTFLLHCP